MAEQSKHTPGGLSVAQHSADQVVSANDGLVAVLYGPYQASYATLFAAAPELAEALKELMEQPDAVWAAGTELADRCRAALKKAGVLL